MNCINPACGVRIVPETDLSVGDAVVCDVCGATTTFGEWWQQEGYDRNPVYLADGAWWHYDETWADVIGPFYSEMDATRACMLYAKGLDSEEEEAMSKEGTTPAPIGQVWICGACGKTSPTKYGFNEHDINVAEPGWDESCMLNSVLCVESSIQRGENGRVTHADAVEPKR